VGALGPAPKKDRSRPLCHIDVVNVYGRGKAETVSSGPVFGLSPEDNVLNQGVGGGYPARHVFVLPSVYVYTIPGTGAGCPARHVFVPPSVYLYTIPGAGAGCPARHVFDPRQYMYILHLTLGQLEGVQLGMCLTPVSICIYYTWGRCRVSS